MERREMSILFLFITGAAMYVRGAMPDAPAYVGWLSLFLIVVGLAASWAHFNQKEDE